MKVLLVHPPCGPRTDRLAAHRQDGAVGLGNGRRGGLVATRRAAGRHDGPARPTCCRRLKHFTPDVAGVTSEMARTGPALDVLRTIRQAAPVVFDRGGRPSADDHARGVRRSGRRSDRPGRRGRSVRGNLCGPGGGQEPLRPHCGPDDSHARRTCGHRAPPAAARHQPPTAARPVAYGPYRRDYFYITEPSAAGVRIAFGCPYRCRFCPGWIYSGGYWVPRDPKLIFDDICSIREPFIYFYDENSFHDVERMKTLAQMLIGAGVKKRLPRLRAGRQRPETPRSVRPLAAGRPVDGVSSAWNRSTPRP